VAEKFGNLATEALKHQNPQNCSLVKFCVSVFWWQIKTVNFATKTHSEGIPMEKALSFTKELSCLVLLCALVTWWQKFPQT